jgi:hypothetical protein
MVSFDGGCVALTGATTARAVLRAGLALCCDAETVAVLVITVPELDVPTPAVIVTSAAPEAGIVPSAQVTVARRPSTIPARHPPVLVTSARHSTPGARNTPAPRLIRTARFVFQIAARAPVVRALDSLGHRDQADTIASGMDPPGTTPRTN